MGKIIFFSLFSIICCFAQAGSVNAQARNKISIDVTDTRKVITRDVNKNLLLRLVKDSINHEHFCWYVEVFRKPYRKNSANLIYTNKTGVTSDRSQVCAWQVSEQYFPNERELKVRGYPFAVKIALINPATEGTESSARFVSGTLEVSWMNKR